MFLNQSVMEGPQRGSYATRKRNQDLAKKKKVLLPGFHGSDFTQNHPSNPINPNFPLLAIRSLCAESKAGVGLENTFTGRQIRGQMSRAANRRALEMSQLLPAAASAYCVVFVFSQNKRTDPKTLNFKALGQKGTKGFQIV